MKTNWQEIKGWLSEAEGAELQRLAADRVVLEIGAYHGRSTVAMAQVARHVVTIDHFKGDGYTNGPPDMRDMLNNLDKFGVAEKVSVIIGDVRRVLPMLDGSTFDVVFYDANHDGPTTEFALNWATAMPRALVAVHDYANDYEHYRDAYNAINRFAERTQRKIKKVGVLASMGPGVAAL